MLLNYSAHLIGYHRYDVHELIKLNVHVHNYITELYYMYIHCVYVHMYKISYYTGYDV